MFPQLQNIVNPNKDWFEFILDLNLLDKHLGSDASNEKKNAFNQQPGKKIFLELINRTFSSHLFKFWS
jgi:hypothetical protein